MKIAVFGASGKTGILTVFQALDKGHEVKAFSRKASGVTIRHQRLTVVEGDILDYEQVRRAVEGCDAVISALGVRTRAASTVLSEGTANIIKAMKESGVKRIICMSSAGILGNDAGFLWGKIIFPLFLKQVLKDKQRQAELIRESGLEWVIIRPSRLTDSPRTGTCKISDGAPGPTIPRADVADFMLKLAADKQYDGRMPAISS